MIKGDVVRKKDLTKINGVVKYRCCIAATKAGGASCPKSICNHQPQDYLYVVFPTTITQVGGTFSYHESEVELDLVRALGVVDQTIADTSADEGKADVPVVDTEKAVADKVEQIKAATKYDKKWFDRYNYEVPSMHPKHGKDLA